MARSRVNAVVPQPPPSSVFTSPHAVVTRMAAAPTGLTMAKRDTGRGQFVAVVAVDQRRTFTEGPGAVAPADKGGATEVQPTAGFAVQESLPNPI
jgi:hypothetical protein